MPEEAAAQPASAPDNPLAAVSQEQTTAGSAVDNTLGTLETRSATVNMAERVVNNTNNIILGLGVDLGVRQPGGRKKGRGVSWAIQGALRSDQHLKKFEQALEADPSSSIAGEEEREGAMEKLHTQKKLPGTEEEVRTWYRELNNVEKCFVQAVAVLPGAPEHEVRRATDELYRPIQEAEERRHRARLQFATWPNEGTETFSVPPDTLPITLDTLFLSRTRTIVRQFDRARRIFWQDTERNEYSPLSVLVLKVIEKEMPLGGHAGQVGQNLLERLEQLPTKVGGESSWRVARSLGSLWVEGDGDRLRAMANDWASGPNSDDFWGWRVGHLLQGAFTVEYNQQGQQAYEYDRSVVLTLLNDWISAVHSDRSDAVSIRLGCTAAMTYRLLGAQHIQVALRGLDELLQFPSPTDEEESPISDDVFVAIISAYAILATYGNTREVLKNLAEGSERFAHQRQDIRWRDKQQDIGDYRFQRILRLIATLNIFALLVGGSFGALQEDTGVPYTPPLTLAERPEIPGENNVDTLLTGIIASGETIWREHISSILCAIFVEGYSELALLIMRVWTEEILALRGPGALRVRHTYLDFVIVVIQQAEQWCKDLRSRGFQTRTILPLARTVIRRWQKESRQPPHPLGAFAEDLLRQLPS